MSGHTMACTEKINKSTTSLPQRKLNYYKAKQIRKVILNPLKINRSSAT